MPIYSDNDAEVADRFASYLAGAGATSSLAAAAAATLKADPSASLPPRFKNALLSVERVLARALVAVRNQTQNVEFAPGAALPEQLVAKLAQGSPLGSSTEGSAEEKIGELLKDVRSLLDEPTTEVAERAERFLGQLSEIETSQAQALDRASLDFEFMSARYAIA